MPAARRTEVSLAAQAFALRQLVPDSKAKLRPGSLRWRGRVQPTPQTHNYELRLDAQPRRSPSVHVIHPPLIPNDDGLLPHVFDTGALCLSKSGDWTPRMLFADTYVPWAMKWLMYYELWRATDLWYGDGPDHLDDVSQSSILHPFR